MMSLSNQNGAYALNKLDVWYVQWLSYDRCLPHLVSWIRGRWCGELTRMAPECRSLGMFDSSVRPAWLLCVDSALETRRSLLQFWRDQETLWSWGTGSGCVWPDEERGTALQCSGRVIVSPQNGAICHKISCQHVSFSLLARGAVY